MAINWSLQDTMRNVAKSLALAMPAFDMPTVYSN